MILASLILAACGGAAPASVQKAGVLRVAMQPIVQTDPAFVSSDAEVLVANHVYDYLVDIDPESMIQPRSAEDVAWTFNRLRDPALELPTSSLYSNVASVSASGDLEVTFTLNELNPFFLFDLSDNHALILKAGTEDAGTSFNGTGPFKVTEYILEDRIVMEANGDYFINGQPKLAGLEIVFFNDEAASVNALRSGAHVDLTIHQPSR
jgi:peptide/nickel transport system substrate-binding protein